MIRCPAPGERKCSWAADGEELKHQGAENSALKNNAPFSLTAFRTSESTSTSIASRNWAFVSRIRDAKSNLLSRAGGLDIRGTSRLEIQRRMFTVQFKVKT